MVSREVASAPYQIVPDEEARRKKVATRIALPLESMLIFSLPKELRQEVRQLMRVLTRLSDTRFGTGALEMSGKIPTYNFKDHEKSLNLALAQCCAEAGWDARGTFRDKTLGYLMMDSFLRWKLFQIKVRKVVLDLFNDSLDKVRLKIPVKGRIILENPPTEAKIYAALEDLSEGRDSFLKIMDRFHA